MAEKLQYCLSGKPVALVTGGFHTASIAHVLKENQIPFVVVTPTVERLDQEQLYVRSLTEPPHETVEAREPYSHAIDKLKPIANQRGLRELIPWFVPRETRVFKWLYGKFGAIKPPKLHWLIRMVDGLHSPWLARAAGAAVVVLGYAVSAAAKTVPVVTETIQTLTVSPTSTIEVTQRVVHVIDGNILNRIAHKTGETVQAYLEANSQILDPDKIKAGWDLVVPHTAVGHMSETINVVAPAVQHAAATALPHHSWIYDVLHMGTIDPLWFFSGLFMVTAVIAITVIVARHRAAKPAAPQQTTQVAS